MEFKHVKNFEGQKGVLPVLPEEIDDFETEATRFRQGEWDPGKFTAFRLCQGVYGQRQADAQMFRIKIPFGGLTAEQLEALGRVVRDYVPLGKGHITTRENIQLHFIPLENTPEVMRVIGEAGLSTREACGNTVRNVTSCPMAGVCQGEIFDVTPYVGAFARYFLRHPFTQTLPRKFKVAFSGCPTDCAITGIHDLGFLAQTRSENGQQSRGFRIVTGGGLSILPRVAYTLYDFVPISDYLKVSEAVIRIFHRSDELRKNKMKARIKFLIDRIGIDAFREMTDEELQQPWAQEPIDPEPYLFLEDESASAPGVPAHIEQPNGNNRAFHHWRDTNVLPQRQKGYHAVFVKVPLGDIRTEQFFSLARIAREYAGGRARTTHQQNLIFRWVREETLYPLWRELEDIGLAETEVHTITDVTSCPGTDSCKLGITSSMGLAHALRKSLLEDEIIKDPFIQDLHVKMSGCPNSCGQHHLANIGFHGAAVKGVGNGNQVPAYEVFLGGSYADGATRIGKRIRSRVPAKRTPEALRKILIYYQENRNSGETFNDFVDRVGPKGFEAVLKDITKVLEPPEGDALDLYKDWGKDEPYKLERGEGECAM